MNLSLLAVMFHLYDSDGNGILDASVSGTLCFFSFLHVFLACLMYFLNAADVVGWLVLSTFLFLDFFSVEILYDVTIAFWVSCCIHELSGLYLIHISLPLCN